MSRLVADMYEGEYSRIPVGQRIFTQDGSQLTENEKPLSFGAPLTSLYISQFDVFGTNEDVSLVRNTNTNTIKFAEPVSENNRRVAEVAFNAEEGILHFVRRDSEEFTVAGFLTQSDFGIGPPGPKGPPGYDAFEGNDGSDGSDGPDGCAGEEGPCGEEGPSGESGEDGVQGPEGPPGGPGKEGLLGFDGPPGRVGNEGCEGEQGCSGECLGSVGIAGTEPNFNVVFSATAPTSDTAYIWGLV
jgi:hypothetical protein